jgi:glyoxylase I family protein
MKMEHVAVNVADPVAMAAWYVKNLGMEVVLNMDDAPFTHFLRDSGGMMMVEIYKNPADNVPDYARMDPLLLHIAFVSDNPDIDKSRLLQSGATVVDDLHLKDGSHLVMMRDPWGLCLQFCKRGVNLLSLNCNS